MSTLVRAVVNGKEVLLRSVITSDKEKITNLAIATPNSEVSHTLEDGLIQLLVRSRVLATLKIAFTATESGTNYVTIKPGTVFRLDEIFFTGKTLYVQSNVATTLEIMELYT